MPALLIALIVATQGIQAVALPRAVPYLPQTEALCGGAAAAMVMRYWGAANARPEDFAPLIDPAQDGIVTTALVADLQRRGWQAFPLRGGFDDDAVMRQHVSRGRPIIALIEDRPTRFHYVVVTAIDEARVSFHDPAVAPSQTMPRAEFARRWQAANFWMLLLLPGTGTRTGTRTEPTEPMERVEPVEPVEPIASAVATLLRSGDTREALRIATEATTNDPASAAAWDALATTLFVMDREVEALEAWNRAGKPDVDTVQIAGLSRTRFRAAESLIGMRPGDRLTASALGRARKRLALLPSAASSRVDYAPLADGRVQVDAAIAERSRRPGASELLVAAAKAPFSRDVQLSFTNLVGGGERVTGSWRFREGFERIEAAVEAPAPLPLGAVWKVSGYDAREAYSVRGVTSGSRWQRGGFQATDWSSPALGWTIGAGLERWPADLQGGRDEKLYVAGRAMLSAGSRFDAHVTAEGWTGGAGATRLSALARAAAGVWGGRLALSAGTEGVHGRTPVFLWPGAGDGNLRAPLLRAHPLVRHGTINVDEGQLLGRRLLHGTVEWTRPVARLAIATVEAAVFADAARGWQLLDSRPSDHQIDAGAGLRVRALGAGPTFRLDIARGLRDGRWAVTAGTVVGVEKWIF
ncbi:MAG TPA: C39 family peptidase [Vicinamibacterales bacterium]|nr:C39 family peptidase [Vicinamibacterales bacterium]